MAKKRRYLSFGLRSLLIGTTITGIVLGLWVGPALRQHRAVTFYEKLSLKCEFENSLVWVPASWEAEYVSYFRRLKSVQGRPVSGIVADRVFTAKIPAQFEHEAEILEFLPNLRSVVLTDLSCTGFLQDMADLEVLMIANPNEGLLTSDLPVLPGVRTVVLGVTRKKIDCKLVRHFPNAKTLVLSGDIKDFEAVSQLKKLEKLFIGCYGPRPQFVELEPLSELRRLRLLRLHVDKLPNLAPLLELPALEHVHLPVARKEMRNDLGLSEQQLASRRFAIQFRSSTDQPRSP